MQIHMASQEKASIDLSCCFFLLEVLGGFVGFFCFAEEKMAKSGQVTPSPYEIPPGSN